MNRYSLYPIKTKRIRVNCLRLRVVYQLVTFSPHFWDNSQQQASQADQRLFRPHPEKTTVYRGLHWSLAALPSVQRSLLALLAVARILHSEGWLAVRQCSVGRPAAANYTPSQTDGHPSLPVVVVLGSESTLRNSALCFLAVWTPRLGPELSLSAVTVVDRTDVSLPLCHLPDCGPHLCPTFQSCHLHQSHKGTHINSLWHHINKH